MAAPGVARAQTIGPDAYGYTLTRINNGAANYTDISSTGTRVTNALGGAVQDDVTLTVNLPFTYNYYGTPATQVFVSTNGFIAFGGNTGSATSGSYGNPSLAGTGSPAGTTITGQGQTGAPTTERAVLAPYWDDLYFTNSAAIPGGIFTLSPTVGTTQEFVIEWHGVQYFGATANTLTFEAVLRDNGSASFYYPDASGPAGSSNGVSASIGTHDLNGGGATNRYLSFDFNGSPNTVNNGDQIDVLTAVPEPGTLALCGLAVAGLALRRRRAKAA